MPRGGVRPGSGRPKGATGPQEQTIEKSKLRQALRDAYAQHMSEMMEAQFANAKGLKYLVARNAKTGKFERVTQAMLNAQLDQNDEAALERIEVWEKDPSVQAWTDLTNRVLDKPAEAVDMHVTGEVDIVSTLQKARERLKKR